MKVFKILDRIFEILSPTVYLAYGIFVLCFSGYNYVAENFNIILGIIMMIGGVAEIVDYIGGHKIKHEFNFDVAFGIISITVGILFICKPLSLDTICLIWGILEIVKGAFEVQHILTTLKSGNYFSIIEFGCAALEIAFGTLLCIHTAEEIKVHLIVVGIIFIISAVKQVIETIMEHKTKKEGKAE